MDEEPLEQIGNGREELVSQFEEPLLNLIEERRRLWTWAVFAAGGLPDVQSHSLTVNASCQVPIGAGSTLLLFLVALFAYPHIDSFDVSALFYALYQCPLPCTEINFDLIISYYTLYNRRTGTRSRRKQILAFIFCILLFVFFIPMYLCYCFLSLSMRLVFSLAIVFVFVWCIRIIWTHESSPLHFGDQRYPNVVPIDGWQLRFEAVLNTKHPYTYGRYYIRRALLQRYVLAAFLVFCVWYFFLDQSMYKYKNDSFKFE